jgi:MFS superfamily sulfate permease-like transporter
VVLDSAAIGDVDYTAGSVLIQVIEQLHQRHIRFVVTSMLGPVRRQLDRYGVGGPSGPDAYFETPARRWRLSTPSRPRQRPARASDR